MPVEITQVIVPETGGSMTGDGSIASPFEVADGGVSTAKLANSAVSTDKLADGSVTANKLGNSGVTAGNYGSATLIPVITVNAKGQITSVTEVAVSGGGGGGSSYAYYEFEDGGDVIGWVFADGAGVTFTKDPATGEFVFNVPDGVLISGGGFEMASSDSDGSNDIFIQLNFAGTRNFNQDIETAWVPFVQLSNGQTTPSRANPSFRSNTQQVGITSVGSNNIEILVDDAGAAFPASQISFLLP